MKKKRWIAVLTLLFVFAAFFPGAHLHASVPEDSGGYVNAVTTARETVWKAITSGMGSGASVAIMDQGRIVYSENMGVADRAANRPVAANTRFNIGSTSKMFAAVAILLLVDEGRVILDEPVKTYLPEFTMQDERYRAITVRMLFNHSSGLPGSSFYFGYKPDRNMHAILLETLRVSGLKHAPGAMSSIYCNDGFTLAEMVVERVSGLSYLDFLRQRVFTPLGMVNTGASVGESGGANLAEYYLATSGVKYPREVVSVYGAGGLSSTVEDLCRFGDSLAPHGANRLLSDSSLEVLLTTQPTPFSDKLRGRQMMSEFGWDYSNLPGYMEHGIQVLGKGGNTGFYSANLQVVPHERLVIALSISGQASGEALTRPILDALMLDKGLMENIPETPRRPVVAEPIPDDILGYEGVYTDGTKVVRVAVDGDNQLLRITPQPNGDTFPAPAGAPLALVYNGGSFFHFEDDIEMYFARVGDTDYMVMKGKFPYPFDLLRYQRLKPVEQPQRLEVDVHEKIWLFRNAPAYIQEGPQPVRSLIYEELPGYVDFFGIKMIAGGSLARIAATAFRDQSNIDLAFHDGTIWARYANFFLSVADDFRAVRKSVSTPVGKTSTNVRIGQAGYNEWLRVEEDFVLDFAMPENGRVVVSGLNEVLFDSVVDSAPVYVPAGKYVFLAGEPGDLFQVYAE
jgi:CubicO group peptidase (beta-lactamase class C family)